MGTRRVSAAVDTAATRNFIHPDYLPSDTKFKRVNLVATLAAKQQTMTITGTTCITISINERTYSLPVCIAPTVTEPLVLGIPWIREEKAIIDAGRNVLHFGKTQRQTVPFLQFQATRITPAQPVQLTTGFPERLRKEVDELFAQHAHVLSPHPGSLTRTNSISHKITLKEDTTFRLPLYRYSEEKRQEIDRQIEHCPGKLNELPDLLSRNPIGSHTELENWDKMMPPDVTSQQQSTSPRLMLINITEPLVEKIKEEQQKDPAHAHIAKQCMLGRSRRYQIAEDGLWYFDQRQEKWKLSVPKDTKPRVLHDFHDAAGHPGEDETYRAIRDRFYWPNIKKSVRNHVKLCRICACGKKSKSSNTDIRPHQPKEPWSSIAVDFMGPYPITARRKRFILVVTDLFSRWTEAFPMVTSDTEKVIRIMEDEVFGRWGYPQSILSDNGPQFRSAKWQQACDKWQAKLYTTAIYSPRANPTERRNQEIKKGLRLHLMDQQQHQQWDLRLPQVLYDLRCRRNAATGQTPAYILFGKELNRPGDWKLTPNSSITDNWKERVEQTRKAQTRYQKKYATTETNKADYSLGDLVYTKAHHLSSAPDKWHAGFGKKWEGPFQVIAQVSEDVFILNKNESETKTHRSEIKPAETQGLEFPAATHSNSDSTTSPESPANTRSNADSTQGLEFPADTPSNIDSTPSPVPPANTRSNADSTQGLEFPADTPSPSPVPPANTCSNADSTTRSDTHPATPTLEEESKEDCSGEHGHRYNLRRRNK
uniref:RNA-directed DNA polymerase n=1 Tax=Trichogramma kaykai TaxID=54128 RepID=A0ABD2XQC3_9HYME